MKCRYCEAEVPDGSKICPNCGMLMGGSDDKNSGRDDDAGAVDGNPTSAWDPSKSYNEMPKEFRTNRCGVFGLILALLSIWMGVYFAVVPAISVVLSAIGVANAKKMSYLASNRSAYIGLIIGCITLLAWVLLWILASEKCFALMMFSFE